MKTLDRYVLRELAVPFLMGTVVIGLLFIANEFIAVFKNFELNHVPILAIVQIVLFRFPHWLSYTLPTGTALAAGLAISRLARESEVTAMRAAGVSVKRILWPVAMAGLLIAVVNFVVVERLVPPAGKAYNRLLQEFVFFSSAPRFQSNVMRKLDRYVVSIGTVQRGVPGQALLSDIIVIERPQPGEVWIYTAKSGIYQDGVWRMSNPYFRQIVGDDLFQARSDKDLIINEPIQVSDLFANQEPEEKSVGELMAAIRAGQRARQDTTNLQVTLHIKYSVPASCLVFAITSGLLGIKLSRSGPFVGVMLSLGVVMLYYNAHVICTQILTKHGWVNPVMAAWLPNIIFLLFALWLVRRTE